MHNTECFRIHSFTSQVTHKWIFTFPFLKMCPGKRVTARKAPAALKAMQHIPDATWQRGEIFHFSEANKPIYNRKFY